MRYDPPMARIRIQPGNIKRFNASFHDDVCIQCDTIIEEGDPIGFLVEDQSRAKSKAAQFGPLCDHCIEEHGEHAIIQVGQHV
jgi:hypothetical protein